MSKERASKGFLLPPSVEPNISAERRSKWLSVTTLGFVSPSAANKAIYAIILNALWPEGHGIPGPILSEKDIRAAIDAHRISTGKEAYKDVFRRLRELQGDEGLTSIRKEGTKYQLQALEIGAKREPRGKPSKKEWAEIKQKYGFHCAHCGAQEPAVKLSPDHRVPRARGGGNELENWQPLCEQCNNIKSSTCRGCSLNCYVCSWGFPESYKAIILEDDNKVQIKREAEKLGQHQSDLANKILREYFNKSR